MSDLILPLTQSEEFERTCNILNVPVQRIESEAGTCLVQSRKFPVFGTFNLISRGPVLRPGARDQDFLAKLRRTIRGPLVINAPVGHGGCGLKIMAGAELAVINLQAPEKMRVNLHQKWRNQLNKGARSGLIVRDQKLDHKRHQWFFEAEQAQQRSRKYRGYPAGFLLAFAAANLGQARLYTAMFEQTPVAAMLVLKHGLMATYQAGVTTPEGQKHCAHNLLLWSIMSDLQRRGVQRLDLGRADLTDGLRRFKCGAGARLESLLGTYLTVNWKGQREDRGSVNPEMARAG